MGGDRCGYNVDCLRVQLAAVSAERDELLAVANMNKENWVLRAGNLHNEVNRLREAVKTTTVHLMAAISLLEDSPKTAAPSDKMFDIMLNDYRKAVEIGRAAAGYTKGADDADAS
jgi:hypothetical protein